MMDSHAFVKHAAVYGLAGLLVQAGGFVLLPLYTRCLTPADYAVLDVLSRMAETIGICLMFGGLRQALLTFYQQSRHETERRQVVATMLSLFGTTIFLGGGLLLALTGPLSGLLNYFLRTGDTPIHSGLFRLALLAVLIEPFTQIPLTLLQARVESVRFVTITLSQFLLRIVLCVVLVKYLHRGVAGALASSVAIGLLFGVYLCTREWLRSPGRPSFHQLRGLVRFALPFVPGGLCFFILHRGDSFFLLRYRGLQEAGTYAVGYKLALAAGMFGLSPLYMVWSSQMYKVAQHDDAPVIFGTVITRILAVFLLVALALALFQDEVVLYLCGARYAAASAVVAPVLLACFFQSAASLMDAGLYVRHRTELKLGITLATTALMLLLYALLIPSYGSMGAAISTLLGFTFFAVSTWAVSQRVFFIRYEWSRLAALLSLAIGLWLVSRLLPTAWWVLPIKAGLWLLAPILVWSTGLMSAREKVHVRAMTSAALAVMDRRVWSRTLRFPYRKPEGSAEATPSLAGEDGAMNPEFLPSFAPIAGGDRRGN